MDLMAALIPLFFGAVIGFVLALSLSSPRRRSPAPAPRPQRVAEAPRPVKVPAEPADDAPRRAELKRLSQALEAAQREAAKAAAERKALVAEHEAALARRDKSIADHRAEIELRDARVHELRAQLAALGGVQAGDPDAAPAAALDLRTEADRAQRAAAAAEQKLVEREQRVAGLQKELASVREELSSVRKRSGELSRSVEELTPRFAERNRLIAQLEASLSQAQAELAKHPLAAPVTVDAAAAEKSANARVLAAYKHDMALQEEEKAALRRELAKRDARIRELTGRADGAAAPARPDGAATPARPVKADDLKVIKGIGPVYAKLLGEAGIRTFADLAGADPTRLAATVTRGNGVPPDVSPWIDEARALLAAR